MSDLVNKLIDIFNEQGYLCRDDYESVLNDQTHSREIDAVNNWIMTSGIPVLKKKPSPDVSKKYKDKVVKQIKHPDVRNYKGSIQVNSISYDYLISERRTLEQFIKDNKSKIGDVSTLLREVDEASSVGQLDTIWRDVWKFREADTNPRKRPTHTFTDMENINVDVGDKYTQEQLQLVPPTKKKPSKFVSAQNAGEVISNILDNITIVTGDGSVGKSSELTNDLVTLAIVWTDDREPVGSVFTSYSGKSVALEAAFALLEEYVLLNVPEKVEKAKAMYGDGWEATISSMWDGRAFSIPESQLGKIVSDRGISQIRIPKPVNNTKKVSIKVKAQVFRAKIEVLKKAVESVRNNTKKISDDIAVTAAASSTLLSDIPQESKEVWRAASVVTENFTEITTKLAELTKETIDAEQSIKNLIFEYEKSIK